MADNLIGKSVLHGARGAQIGKEITPTVVIGLGGSGKDALLMLRRKFFDRFGDLADFPVVSYAFIDTDQNMRTPLSMDQVAEEIPARIAPRPDEYVCATIPNPATYTRNLDQYPHIKRWFSPALVGMFPIHEGAGGIRQKSRLAFYHNFDQIATLLDRAKQRATDPAGTDKVAKKYSLRTSGNIQFFVISSLAGGTGSGMFLDIAFLVQARYPGCRRVGYLVAADIFGNDEYLYANSYAALRELEHFSFVSDFDYQWQRGYPSHPLPMHVFEHCFLIGNRNRFQEYPPDIDGKRSLFDMIAEAIFQEFGRSEFADVRRGIRVNLMSDQEKAFHLADMTQEGEAISSSKKDIFPEIYATFGLSILRIPLDRIKKGCAYKLTGEVLEFWRGGGGGPQGAVSLRDFTKMKIMGPLNILEEKDEKGRHDLLNRLYKDPRTGAQMPDEIRNWVPKIRQLLGAKDIREAVIREVDKFRTEKLAAGGHFVKQVADNSEEILDDLRSNLARRVRELINKEGMAASADGILKDIAALIDDPQEAYIPTCEEAKRKLDAIAKATQAAYESALSDLVEVAGWISPLKLPFRDLAMEARATTLVNALRDHFTARLKSIAREKCVELLKEVKALLASDQSPRHFMDFLDQLGLYVKRMQESYRRTQKLIQVTDVYRDTDIDTKYFPMLVGKDGSKERAQAVERASGMVLDGLKALYPTMFEHPEPLKVLDLAGQIDLKQVGDTMASCLKAKVDELDDKVSVFEAIQDAGMSDAELAAKVRLCDPWLAPEQDMGVNYRLDPALTKYIVAAKEDPANRWRELKPKVRGLLDSIQTGSTSETPVGDPAQVIFYCERARFPLFYNEIVKRYRKIYQSFRAKQRDYPVHIDVGLIGLRDVAIPAREERERERNARKLLFLARVFKGGLKTERISHPDGTRTTRIMYEYEKVGDRFGGGKEERPLGADPETALKVIAQSEEIYEALDREVNGQLAKILNSPRWPELRALLMWYRDKHFKPSDVQATDAGDLTVQRQAMPPERVIIERELIPMFDPKFSRLRQENEAKVGEVHEFTKQVLADISRFDFVKSDPTQADFTGGPPQMVWVDDAGRQPAVSAV